MALTDTERDRIVALRLAGRSIREVMADTGHASATVHKVWHLYLAETAQARRPDLGLRREELLQRLERNAADAREGVEAAVEAGDHATVCRYLAAELAALRRVVELEGLQPGTTPAVTVVRPATVADPLPWTSAAEALGYRVAKGEADRARVKAEEALYGLALPVVTPDPDDMVPAVVEALTSST